MELNSVNIYGQCRCCSATGNHKDLWKEYCWNGIREVYSDVMYECFNLRLSTNMGLSTLICSKCIERLRDASSFKILVVNTEKQLLESVEASQNIIYQSPENIKQEIEVKVEPQIGSDDEWSGDCPNEDNIYHDEISVPIEFTDKISLPKNDLVEGEAELNARFASLKPLPKRENLRGVCPNFVKHLDILKGKKVTGKSIETLLQNDSIQKKVSKILKKSHSTEVFLPNLKDAPKKKRIQKKKYNESKDNELDIDKVKNPYTFERLTHATNIAVMLEFSNVTAFKSKFQRAYPCFYCEKLFEHFEELKNHQKIDHTKDNVRKCVLQKYRVGRPDGVVVYVDISDLKCTICDKDIPNLNDLKKHLTEIHLKKMYPELSDRVIPFIVKENNIQCQICGNLYETFGAIERHMNTHYRNFVCEECDSGFITKQRLRVHGYQMHSRRSKESTCEVCQKRFTSQQKMKIHVETVHENVKKYKCNRCPERFNEYFRRHRHMVQVHGVAPIEYKCNVCDKIFERRYGLSSHMRTHIQQKDIYCEVCPYRCFTKAELRNHMIKHNGERIHECSVCKKSYAREKTLKEHMRIHTNDRRYICPVCGQAFIQNCSLKSHVRSNHKEHGLM